MKEKPILFSTEMVQAILDGRKTQTRRTFKYQPFSDAEIEGPDFFNTVKYDKDGYTEEGPEVYGAWDENNDWGIKSPYQPGDILWVRETWNECGNFVASCCHNSEAIAYKTKHAYWVDWDGFFNELDTSDWAWEGMKWKPSIHMPKDAARIWLKVTNVRCERLDYISREDAIKEGIEMDIPIPGLPYGNYNRKGDDCPYYYNPIHSFMSLWESINGLHSWNENPWVWVYEFEVLSTTGKQ